MVRMVVDSQLCLRPMTSATNSKTKIAIDQIDWCIENSLTRDTEIYAIVQGQKNKLYDIVRLAPIKPYDKNHTIYNIVPGYSLRVNEEQVLLKLLILSKNKFEQRITNSIAFVILTKDYALIRQTAIAQELGLVIEGYYRAIVSMYNELKKGDTSDDS